MQLKEERSEQMNPDGSGVIDVVRTLGAQQVLLGTHPGEDCCPLWTLDIQEVRGVERRPWACRR